MNEYAELGFAGLGGLAGAKLSHYANADLQERQFAAQERFQERAFKMNEQAVRNQAPLQLQGMQNAGLNPSAVTGTGAPSVQSGAAAGASSQLGNIFDGIAEIVQAAKLPTDVERTKAETENTKTNTSATKQQMDVVIPAQIEKLSAEVASLRESTRSAKNANDAFAAADDFLRTHSSVIFEKTIEKMKQDGVWDSLQPDTKKTFEGLAKGDISLGVGEIESLKKVIDTQSNLSDSDRKLVENGFENFVKLKQWKDDEVMSALAKLPKDNQDMIRKHIDKLSADIAHIEQLIKESKASEALKYAQKAKTDFERESAELNDVKWLIKHGRLDDADVKTWEQTLNNVHDVGMSVLNTVESVGEGIAIGKGIGAGKAVTPAPEKPLIFPPNERQILKTNTPKSFGDHLNFSR